MKHTITLTLQQITDLEAIRTDLANAGDREYGKAADLSNKASNLRIRSHKEISIEPSLSMLNEARRLDELCDECNAEGDRLMNQARVVHSIIKQIKKNG